jgi:hypothetical protein
MMFLVGLSGLRGQWLDNLISNKDRLPFRQAVFIDFVFLSANIIFTAFDLTKSFRFWFGFMSVYF